MVKERNKTSRHWSSMGKTSKKMKGFVLRPTPFFALNSKLRRKKLEEVKRAWPSLGFCTSSLELRDFPFA